MGPCGVYSWLTAVVDVVVDAVLVCTTVQCFFFRLDSVNLRSRSPGTHGDSSGETLVDFCGNGESSIRRDEGVLQYRI